MSDISITVTADPQQAIRGLEQVRKEADRLADSQRKVQEAADAASTDAINSVSSVSSKVAQSITQTGTGLGSISSGIKAAGVEAGKVAGAFGKSIPVIGQLGSAIGSALTGPVAAVSAAIGLAIAGINKMIQDAEDRVQRLKLSVGTQANTAYDRLMQGRSQYAADLQTLSQVKQINALAKESALSASDLAAFRQLASQIGVAERDVTARGIKQGRLADAERTLKQQRAFYARQDYDEFIEATTKQLTLAIKDSGLPDAVKKQLAGKSALSLADTITQRAQSGAGWTLDEYKAWQDLYGIAKQINEVRASYNTDFMLGRSQTDLNAAAVASITGKYSQSARGAADSSSGGSASPGTLAWQKEQDKLAMKAAEAEKKDRERRESAAANLNAKLEEEIQIQQLINDGKQKEAFILRNRISLENAYGRALTDAEAAENARLASTLYDLQHPAGPSPEPWAGAAAGTPERAVARSRTAAASANLDRLQRIGANAARAAAANTPEKIVMDKQLNVQEQMNAKMDALIQNSYKMRF